MLKLPSIFSNNMVMQRRKGVRIFGFTDSSTNNIDFVIIQLETTTHKTISEIKTPIINQKFDAVLPPMESGEIYNLIISYKNEQKIFTNIVFGEVWLAGGQSNMELELQNCENGKEIVKNLTKCNIRYYYTPKISWVGQELFDAENNTGWCECSPQTSAAWSAVAWYFAQKVQNKLSTTEKNDIPIGIIGCNWGGTIACNWLPQNILEENTNLHIYLDEYNESIKGMTEAEYIQKTAEYKEYHKQWEKKSNEFYSKNPHGTWQEVLEYAGECKWPGPMGPKHEYRPCGLYESMLLRVAPYTLAGFLYYQGESDEKKPDLYYQLLSSLIQEWRRLWGDISLPFLLIQLPAFLSTDDKSNCAWAKIRSAQLKAANTIQNVFLTCIIDCGEKLNIHPVNKKTPGERLANTALQNVYSLKETNPRESAVLIQVKSCKTVTDGVEINFFGTETGLVLKSNKDEENCFEVAGNNGIFVPANATIKKDENNLNNVLILKNKDLKEPIRYARYGYTNWFTPILFSKAGLPVIPFNISTTGKFE